MMRRPQQPVGPEVITEITVQSVGSFVIRVITAKVNYVFMTIQLSYINPRCVALLSIPYQIAITGQLW
jgi:hypothetical protein